MNLNSLSVLVLGLGESGLAMARWCAAQGARVRVADSRSAPPGLAALQREVPAAQVHCGNLSADLLGDAQLLLRSPGIAPHAAEFAALTQAAAERGVPMAGELHLFQWALDALRAERGYAPKIVAITGTNGKTTVTRLTGLMLERAGWSVAVAGNISPSMLDALQARLDADDLPAAWVLELSSFQLHGMEGFAADAATVLNITQDHLDWHGDMTAYAADKANIFGNQSAQGVMVLNRDDPQVLAMQRPGRKLRRFGLSAPQQPGDWGVVREGGIDWLARALPEEGTPRNRRGAAISPQGAGQGLGRPGALPEAGLQMQRLMPAEALRIQGAHNVANALAALALCDAVGAQLAPMLHALREYRGEPHRMQTVAVIDGVRWIDDSKGTNVGATVAALAGMETPVVLIAGGDGKGQDFSPLRAQAARLRAAVLIGRDAQAIAAELQGLAPTEFTQSLEQAVQRAATLAKTGDAALLSPACASLDMFRNYAHRAEVFVAAVRELAEQRGQVWNEGADHA
ncbi:MAG: UDP-N-acetylmuramoyl-L-alanine--D-glutamate ligase [Thiomonas sp.]|uniref:UDP-N-acetylmuramoyl-L-alanine--D-glutamate ligase n=1 Tax=Thiomonas TaxID=32012 RepID=UPI00257A036D|nr:MULTISPECIES: UDP-N-acetylmuramoyl-L-alanine--D-glutamate ligase [Thiomonas]HML80560.1 UDP-N-acetylmuramoyl-L-alanine--D-glutamate ligase [Thiomonas arsenitoxydans]